MITVAGFVAGENAFRTLANLNVANRVVHRSTLSILYETMIFDCPVASAGSSTGRKHTR